MLMPKRIKYRKTHRGAIPSGKSKGGNEVHFGDYGLKALNLAGLPTGKSKPPVLL
jgi:large subunit ribosomal protein L16